MRRPAATMGILQLADLLRRSGLFSDAEAQSVLQRWVHEAGDTADGARFIRWLVARAYVTESQANELLRESGGSVAGPAPPVTAAPTVHVAQAPPHALPVASAEPAMRAVIVAPAAGRRPERATPPQTVRPPMPRPAEAVIDVELAALAAPVAPESRQDDAAPLDIPAPINAELDIDVELVPLSAPAPATRPAESVVARPSVAWTHVWVCLFLGALGLMIAEFAGWLLARLVGWVLW